MIYHRFKEAFKKIASPFFKKELNSIDAIASVYQQVQEQNTPAWKNPTNTCSGIVFSKDRAMQLHALLSSYYFYVKNPVSLSVLYTTSNQRHDHSYEELKTVFSHENIQFRKETAFKPDLENLLADTGSDILFFMTDDGMFIDSFDMNEVTLFNPVHIIPSLIKGLDLTYCYIQNRNQQLPAFLTPPQTEIPSAMKCWEWGKAESFSDWAYPLSLDVTFYNKNEIETLITHSSYSGPNSLETNLHNNYASIFLKRKGICFDKAKYVNVVCNVVNNEHKNRNTGLHSTEELLKKWEEGYRIEFEKFFGKNCTDVEQASFNFIKR